MKTFYFKNSKHTWVGNPKICFSNEYAHIPHLNRNQMTVFHKNTVHYPDNLSNSNFMYTMGDNKHKFMFDMSVHRPRFVYIDSKQDILKQFKDLYPDITVAIDACDYNTVDKYMNDGADIIKTDDPCLGIFANQLGGYYIGKDGDFTIQDNSNPY